MSRKGKVLVAMSGGIDSTVAALMLHHEGYEVVGITMKTWDYASSGGNGKKETGCCNLDSFNDARMAAVQHGFPHFVLDIREEFGDFVIENFVDEYLAGRTPNPCVMCNTHIKWRALLKRADAMDCDFIATGHYGVINQHTNGRHYISKGVDDTKDQSYVLWGLQQDLLSRTLLPLGKYHKTEIRQMAHDYGYPELAKKAESYEICFVPDNDYRGFLKRRVNGLEEKVAGGNFVDKEGNILGQHKGYPFYTIGQRKGLDVTFGKPMYVTNIIPETNTVMLGEENDLSRQEMIVSKINWLKYDGVTDGMEATTRIRYKDRGTTSNLYTHENGVLVRFYEDAKGVAPGQSAVFYEGDDVIGGGIIQRSHLL
ncbi:tRNA 2-thiouridine(34) synthase MnmA [Pseudobacter ginsenosidimutans]|jgi:tRNA-specific 2-thiouridylase|uniref:tRNA-specific 2-thiouridylase MnmA n=1 Tax=Pseudobacter ginsenosidimutans TaxID=661488 RepID=A0A4Q7MQE8_9BACT|nr:tRNA 2-thiouridine(34) synthase MnmA [Pseudobacter ginsenosidimutans]QEC40354.1 tRNA 2-thiouridine(34) synthase MnmA [Pseudobacter ginsenosidimutans]RZS69042.1 tRNA (5-methylaminomethyl-2-thiouridylate)-methyltransferase [Pseudobacter ginsenosidimutans]